MKKNANISAIHRLSTHEIFADEFKLVTDQDFPTKVCDIISPVFDVNSVDSNMTIFEDLEGFLALVADVTETCSASQLMFFAMNLPFIEAMSNIILKWVDYEPKQSSLSFQLHNCSHLAIFILMGLLSTSQLCLSFASTIDKVPLKRTTLCSIIGKTILFEIQYSTQEMLLEVMCRMFIIFSKLGSDKTITDYFPAIVKSALISPNIGPRGILQDMRHTLNKLNQSNPNIKTFEVDEVLYINTSEPLHYAFKIGNVKFIDLGLKSMSFYVDDTTIINFPFSMISKVFFVETVNAIQVHLSETLEQVNGVLLRNDFKPSTLSPILEFKSNNSDILNDIYVAINERKQPSTAPQKHGFSSVASSKFNINSTVATMVSKEEQDDFYSIQQQSQVSQAYLQSPTSVAFNDSITFDPPLAVSNVVNSSVITSSMNVQSAKKVVEKAVERDALSKATLHESVEKNIEIIKPQEKSLRRRASAIPSSLEVLSTKSTSPTDAAVVVSTSVTKNVGKTYGIGAKSRRKSEPLPSNKESAAPHHENASDSIEHGNDITEMKNRRQSASQHMPLTAQRKLEKSASDAKAVDKVDLTKPHIVTSESTLTPKRPKNIASTKKQEPMLNNVEVKTSIAEPRPSEQRNEESTSNKAIVPWEVANTQKVLHTYSNSKKDKTPVALRNSTSPPEYNFANEFISAITNNTDSKENMASIDISKSTDFESSAKLKTFSKEGLPRNPIKTTKLIGKNNSDQEKISRKRPYHYNEEEDTEIVSISKHSPKHRRSKEVSKYSSIPKNNKQDNTQHSHSHTHVQSSTRDEDSKFASKDIKMPVQPTKPLVLSPLEEDLKVTNTVTSISCSKESLKRKTRMEENVSKMESSVTKNILPSAFHDENFDYTDVDYTDIISSSTKKSRKSAQQYISCAQAIAVNMPVSTSKSFVATAPLSSMKTSLSSKKNSKATKSNIAMLHESSSDLDEISSENESVVRKSPTASAISIKISDRDTSSSEENIISTLLLAIVSIQKDAASRRREKRKQKIVDAFMKQMENQIVSWKMDQLQSLSKDSLVFRDLFQKLVDEVEIFYKDFAQSEKDISDEEYQLAAQITSMERELDDLNNQVENFLHEESKTIEEICHTIEKNKNNKIKSIRSYISKNSSQLIEQSSNTSRNILSSSKRNLKL